MLVAFTAYFEYPTWRFIVHLGSPQLSPMRLPNTLICHSLASLLLLTGAGCSKKTDSPTPAVSKHSRDYDIRLRYSSVGLDQQEDAGGAPGFDLDTRLYGENDRLIGNLTAARPTGEFVYQTTSNTTVTSTNGYVIPFRVQFTSITALRQPVNFNPTVDIHVNVDIVVDGKVVETLVLNRNTSGFITVNRFPSPTPGPVQGVIKSIDLNRY